jgi:hypothetical protein
VVLVERIQTIPCRFVMTDMLSSVAVYESQTATLAAHMPKSSYHNTTNKSVVAILLQSLHSILKKNTYLSSQHDTEWSIYVLLVPPRTWLT